MLASNSCHDVTTSNYSFNVIINIISLAIQITSFVRYNLLRHSSTINFDNIYGLFDVLPYFVYSIAYSTVTVNSIKST